MTELSVNGLNKALSAMAGTAEKLGVSLTFAIVDPSGVCCACLRMPDGFLASETYAFQKAYTAASFRMSTTAFGDLLDSMPADVAAGLLAHGNVTRLSKGGGGGLIMVEDRLAGAIGVSGGNAEQGAETAAVGLAVWRNSKR